LIPIRVFEVIFKQVSKFDAFLPIKTDEGMEKIASALCHQFLGVFWIYDEVFYQPQELVVLDMHVAKVS